MAHATATKKAPKKAPKSAEDSAAFGPIAERFRRAGDLERAINLCREGLQKYPHHISARVTLGWALLDHGNFDEARVELELVLRRAPDNLAAIRGLAELHDRAEHTMNLPMDGPGQWPPPADAVDDEAEVEPPQAARVVPAKPRKPKAEPASEPVWLPVQRDDDTAPSPSPSAILAPAELGLAMWSPVPEPELDAVPAPVSVPWHAPASTPVDDVPAIAQASVSVPAYAPAAAQASVSAPAPASSYASSTGMSSVRELDPNAGVVTFDVPSAVAPIAQPSGPEELVAWPVEQAVAHYDAPAARDDRDEVDIAALIAEADSLEAAAEARAGEASTLVLDAGMDLAGDMYLGGDVDLGLINPATSHVQELTAGHSAEELVVGDAPDVLVAARVLDDLDDLDDPVLAHPSDELVATNDGPMFALTPPPALILAEEAVEEDLEIDTRDVFTTPLLDAPVVLVASSAVAPAAAVQAEAVAEIPAGVVDEPHVIDLPAPLHFVVPEAPKLDAPRVMAATSPQVLALERFLRQVQARRRHLVAESVA